LIGCGYPNTQNQSFNWYHVGASDISEQKLSFLRELSMEIKEFLSLLKNAAEAIELALNLMRTNRGTKKRILLEMQENIATIQLYIENDLPIDKVVQDLAVEELKDALRNDFNLNSFNRNKISSESTAQIPFFERYTGWTTEELFNNIYMKILELQKIVRLDPDNPNIRKSVRLINIFKLIKLLLIHIDQS
jgi:hypothetical protein